MLLLPLGAIELLVLVWFLSYAAHFFLVVLNDTAQGKNEVDVYFPTNYFLSRLGDPGYLLALTMLCMAPAYVLFRLLDLPDDPGLRVPLLVLALGTSLWLFLPVVLLSLLSSGSRWDVLRLDVLRRFRACWRTVLAFYALSIPLVIGTVLVAYLALLGWMGLVDAAVATAVVGLDEIVLIWSWAFLLPLASAIGAAALLIYARLVGRLAWLLELTGAEEHEPKAADAVPAPGHFTVFGEPARSTEGELAAEDTYGLVAEPSTTEEQAIPVSVDPVRLAVLKPRKVDRDVHTTDPTLADAPLPALKPPPDPDKKSAPRRLLVPGIYRFPWYRASLKAWLGLTLIGLFLALLFRLHLLALI